MADVNSMVAALKAKQQAASQTANTAEAPDIPVPPYDFGQRLPVEAMSGLPVLPNSDYGPPKPISPSDKYGVKNTWEETNLVNFLPNFIGNIVHGGMNIVGGLTNLAGKVIHDVGKGVAAIVPGEQGLDRDNWKLWDEFFVPMTGWGDAESVMIDDWKYRYGSPTKFLRGLYEQPLSFVNDALMVGGAIGTGAKFAARAGEVAAVDRALGAGASAAARAEAEALKASTKINPELGGLKTTPLTPAQRAAVDAAREPWLLRAQRIAAVEPGDVIGQLRPKTFEVPVGIGEQMYTKTLRSNPVARMIRSSIFESPILSQTFGQYDAALRKLTNGVGYDQIVERLYGGAHGWGRAEPDVELAFRNLEDKTGRALSLFRKMQRMVESRYDPSPSAFKYERVFRPYVDRLYESKWFGEIRSTIGANAVERRKRLTTLLGQHAEDYYKALDEAVGYEVPRTEANKLAVNLMQGTAGPEALELLKHSMGWEKGVIPWEQGTLFPNLEEAAAALKAPVFEPPPAKWALLNDAMPEGIPADAPPTNIERVMKPLWDALLEKRKWRDRAGKPDLRIVDSSVVLADGVERKVVNVAVDSIEDIWSQVERANTAMGATVEGVYNTLTNPTTDAQKLVRTVITRHRLPDGSFVELQWGTPDILKMSDSNSTLSNLLYGLEQARDEFYGTTPNGSDGRIAEELSMISNKAEEIKSLREAINGGKVRPNDLPHVKYRLRVAKRALKKLEEDHVKTLEQAQIAWQEVEAAREFGLGMNEGVDRILKEGNNYHPALRLKDELDNTWWREVLSKELGAFPNHPPSMTFSTMMRRKYGVQRVTEAVRMFNRLGDNLYRFLNGDFVDDLMRMSREEKVAFNQKLQLPQFVRDAIYQGDRSVVSNYFGFSGQMGDPTRVIAARVAAFLHMNNWPSEAVQQVMADFFSDSNFRRTPGTIPNVRSRIEQMRLNADIQGVTGGPITSPLKRSATFHGENIWLDNQTYNPALLAHAFKEYAYAKVGHMFEAGDVDGWGWADFHRKWKYEKGMPTPSYYPHIAPPAPGSKVMALGSRLSSIHGRDTWLHEWDGELMKRGIYEQDFFEAYAHKAVQLIRHQEIYDLYMKAKKFARPVSERELDLFDKNWMVGERLWNPDLVDAAFRLSKQARQNIFDLVAQGLSFDEATKKMLERLTPDMAVASARATAGELYAIPTHIADEIERVARLNMGWKVRVFWDSPMQVWRSSVLALSPRWIINNLFGNAYFQMVKDPAALWESIKMFNDEYRRIWSHMSGGAFPSGVDRGLFFEQGNILEAGKYGYAEGAAPAITDLMRKTMETGPAKRLSRMAEGMRDLQGIVEDNFRRGTFAASTKKLVKQNIMRNGNEWIRSARAMEHLMEYGITKEVATQALERVNATLGNYTNLNHLERQIIRRFVMPFYAFYRHSVKFLASMPIENAYKVSIFRNMEKIDQEMYGDDMPEWFDGSVLVGKLSGKDPLWLRTRNWNPLEGLSPSPTGLVGSTNPILRMLFEQQTGISSFSGEKFTSPDTFETPTGHVYRYVTNDMGVVVGVELLGDNERVKPAWIETFLSMFPQYTLFQRGILDPLQGESGAQYSTGGTIMENGTPKYPNPWWSAWAAYFGFPTTTFDPNEYLYKQYKDYWRTGVPMAQSRANQQMMGGGQ